MTSLSPLFLILALSFSTFGADTEDHERDFYDMQIHGFISQGFMKSTDNNYLTTSYEGSFDYTEAALNFTKNISKDLRMGFQVFSRNLGREGTFRTQFDWFYLDYRKINELAVRIGRVKLPFGLYNEFRDVDPGITPILLPQSLYSITSRDFLLAFAGAEVYGRVELNQWGELEYNFYGGTIHTDADENVESLDVPYIYGARALWVSPARKLRLATSAQTLKLDTTLTLNGSELSFKLPATLTVLSLEYQFERSLFALEYGLWFTSIKNSSNTTLFANGRSISERGYAMYNYQLTTDLNIGSYYSIQYSDRDKRKARDQRQFDLALYLRFDITENWLIKFEGHHMDGSAVLDPSLNNGKSRTQLEKDWNVFLVKTTGYF